MRTKTAFFDVGIPLRFVFFVASFLRSVLFVRRVRTRATVLHHSIRHLFQDAIF